jgi:hypothetical protein
MKKFIGGLSTGYLLTSLFSIQAPPTIFWVFFVSSLTIMGPMMYAWHRLNDDQHEGDY